MKKQRKKAPRKKGPSVAPAAAKTDRRTLLRNWLIIGGGVAIASVFAVWTVMATVAEHDLSVVGKGLPVIVQVHDPQCAACVDLQRETRAALGSFDDTDLHYRVANVKSDSGAAFANSYGAGYTTLLLFDADGELQGSLYGIRGRDELRTAFTQLVASDG